MYLAKQILQRVGRSENERISWIAERDDDFTRRIGRTSNQERGNGGRFSPPYQQEVSRKAWPSST